MSSSTVISPALLEEAADWVITLRFSEPSENDRRAFEHWRKTSSAHEAAWARAESMRSSFDRVSSEIGRHTLQGLNNRSKRDTMRKLCALLVIAPAGWLAWRQMPVAQWTADLTTSKGERRTLSLADGSQITLNSNSAVDIVFTATERRLILRAGEILIATHPDSSETSRPFRVQTPQGIARALGTRFSVRLGEDTTRVAVFEHAVEIVPRNGRQYLLQNGKQVVFDNAHILETGVADPNARQWENGMLVARNMRLGDVIAELNKHHRGFLRCDPVIADLRVSGALSLDDVGASLDTLARRFPIQIRDIHHYWIVVEPRMENPAQT